MDRRTKKHHETSGHNGRGRLLRRLFQLWRPGFQFVCAIGIGLQSEGCSRVFYREQTDKEVSAVISAKDKYPQWAVENWHVYPDPQARFADPSDPDHPPKPPDDLASHDLAPNPQKPGKNGVKRIEGTGYLDLIAKWDLENRKALAKREAEENDRGNAASFPVPDLQPDKSAPGVEDPKIKKMSFTEQPDKPDYTLPIPKTFETKPDPKIDKNPAGTTAETDASLPPAPVLGTRRTLLDISGRPTYLLTLEQAAELAMFNSREYQDRRENLYLTALPVTQERFAFSAQAFAAQEAIRSYSGDTATGGPSNNWTVNNGVGIGKALPTGALLLLNFSNQTVFNFMNPSKLFSQSTLNLNAIQPLLRGGGQAVALEALTQSERNLLYQIRSYARFRKELYVEIASNSGGSISGSAFQPTGVVSSGSTGASGPGGNSGLTPGVIAAPVTTLNGIQVAPNSPGFLNLSSALTPPPAGYLNTMLESTQVYIDQENISVLSTIYDRYRGLLDGDVVGPLQVQSVEQQLLGGRYALMTDQQQYLDAIDYFKLTIGVPVDVNIEMDDSALRPLMLQFRHSRTIIEQEQAVVSEASKLILLSDVPRLRSELARQLQSSILSRSTPFGKRIKSRLESWAKLSDKEISDKLAENAKEITRLQNLQADLQREDKDLSTQQQAQLRELGSQSDLGKYEKVLRKYETDYSGPAVPKNPDPLSERRRINQHRDVISYWQKLLVEARDDRWAMVRRDWPDLPRCCVSGVDLVKDDISKAESAAGQYALLNRLDLMNVRGQLVDAWRQIAVYANALLGVFNVQYSMSTILQRGLPSL